MLKANPGSFFSLVLAVFDTLVLFVDVGVTCVDFDKVMSKCVANRYIGVEIKIVCVNKVLGEHSELVGVLRIVFKRIFVLVKDGSFNILKLV